MEAVLSPDDWLTRKEAAEYLGKLGCPITVAYLERMAVDNNAGNGPPFTRTRWRLVRYRRSDLDAWAKREAVRVG